MADLSTLMGMLDVQAISMASAAIGILIGVTNWIRKSSTAERQRQTEIETRRAQLFMGLYEKYRERDFRLQWHKLMHQEWEDFEDWWQKYGPDTNIEAYMSYSPVMGFFKGIGVLLKHDFIDVTLAFDLVGNLAIRLWERMEPIVIGHRKMRDFKMWEDFEYLYDKLKEYKEQQALTRK